MIDPVQDFVNLLLPQLMTALGVDYTVDFLEPTQSELQPKQCWIVVDGLEFGDAYADLLTYMEFKQKIYVTVMYEISTEALHYKLVRLKRKAVMKAVIRATRSLDASIIPTVEPESPVLTEALFASTIVVELIWTEGVDS